MAILLIYVAINVKLCFTAHKEFISNLLQLQKHMQNCKLFYDIVSHHPIILEQWPFCMDEWQKICKTVESDKLGEVVWWTDHKLQNAF